MATDPRTIVNINEDPGLVHPTGSIPTQGVTNGTNEVKTVVINYTDPPLYGVPELQIFNDPGGRNGAVQFNVGNRLGGDSNFVWNSKNRTLSILGNIRISDSIIGKYNTNTKNLKITGGEDGYVLSTDGTGNLSWVAQTGGNGNGVTDRLTNNSFNAILGSDGTLSVPGPITSNVGYGIESVVDGNTSGVYFNGNITEGGSTYVYATSNAFIRANNNGSVQDWNFDSTGNLTTPSGITIGETNATGPTISTYRKNLSLLSTDPHDGIGYVGTTIVGWVSDLDLTEEKAIIVFNDSSGNIEIGTGNSNPESSAYYWRFDKYGNVTLPGNTFSFNYANGDPVIIGGGGNVNLGDFSFNGNTMTVNDNGTIRAYRSAGYQPDITIELDSAEVGITTYKFTSQGLVFPDFTTQNTAYPGYIAPVTVSDNAPNTSIEGNLWFDSQLGRTYIKYNDQWVDMSPQTPINPDIQVTSITFADGTTQTSSSDLGNLAVGDSATLYDKTSFNNLNMNEGGFGEVSLRSFRNDVKIISDYINTSSTWRFSGGGNLVLPNGGKVGAIQFTNGVELYSEGAQYSQLNYENRNFVWTDQYFTAIQTGNAIWAFTEDGNITFPDGTVQETAYTGETNSKVIVSDTPPTNVEQGVVWFNSQQGRTYVKYDNQWVDSNPQTIDARAIRINDVDNIEVPKSAVFTDGRVYQDYTNGFSSMRWTSMTSTTEMLRAYSGPFNDDDEQNERGQLGLAYQGANISGLYIKSFDNNDSNTWTFEGTGNLRFPDDTVQTTAYQPATLLDGGGANSTYTSNVAPGSIPNPFDQELNTNDIVQFANVTAGYFIGDGSQLTNIPTSNTGDVTFNNQIVIGTGDIYGGGGLYLAQGPASVANLQYFRIRGGDNPTHLHFDTGDNNSYDQYFGDDNKYLKLEAGSSGAAVIGTNTNTWTFGIDGNLTLPTNTSSINYANGSPLTAALPNVTTDNFRINGEERGLIVDASDLKRFGFMKYAGIEGSLVHSAYTGAAVPMRIGRTSTADVTAANVDTFTTEIYVGTNGHVRIADDNVNNINDPTERLEVVGNIKANNIGNVAAINLDGSSSNVLYGNGVFAPTAGGSNYSNSNVSSLLESYGSNTISTTGNITGGNLSASANVLSNGYGKFSGTFDESIGASTGVVLGYAGGTPRILLGTGNTSQTFEIDNDGGNLRFYQPGSTKATLTSGGNLSISGSISATNIGNISALNLDGNANTILYGNGVFADAPTSGSTYSNSNVSTFLSSFGSNTISTTGNVSVGNLTFGSNSGQINFHTGAYISGNANSITRDGSILLQPYTGAGSTFPGVIIGGAGRLIAPNGGVFQIFNASDVTFQVAIKSTLSTAATSTTTGALIIPGGAGLAGSITTGVGALLTGPTFTPLANTMAGFVSNVNSYTQLTIQNKSTGADATTDFVATADNGSDTVNYLDLGIINSGYDNLTPTNSLGNIVYAADSYLYAQGNVSNTSQSGGNLAIGTTVAGKSVKIFAGGANANSIVATISNTGLAVTGNVTATNFSGNISITGNVTGTSSNVTLVAGSYSATMDNAGYFSAPTLKSTNSTGNEGGEIQLAMAPNATISGSIVTIDQYVDRVRFFEGGGTTRGAYIDLSQAAAGVGTLLNNRVSGLVNAGTFVTMDLIKATVTSSGNRGLSLAATTGSFAINISGTYGSSGGSSGTCGTATITTTPSGSQFNWNFVSQADGSTYIITDTTNNRAYRITLQIGGSYLNNMISIERLV